MARLEHAPHEYFARLVAGKMPRYKAYEIAVSRGAKESNLRALASQLWRHKGITSLKIQRRVNELQMEARKSATLTAEDILDDMLLDADLARHAGQYSASINARKLIGSELFNMFMDKKINLDVELKATNKIELKAQIVAEYGQELADKIWAQWSGGRQNKLIEASPNHDTTPTEAQGNVIQFPSDTE